LVRSRVELMHHAVGHRGLGPFAIHFPPPVPARELGDHYAHERLGHRLAVLELADIVPAASRAVARHLRGADDLRSDHGFFTGAAGAGGGLNNRKSASFASRLRSSIAIRGSRSALTSSHVALRSSDGNALHTSE